MRHILSKHTNTAEGIRLKAAINKNKSETEQKKKARKELVLEKEKGKRSDSGQGLFAEEADQVCIQAL